MPRISWLIRRLKAMSIPEVMWRLSQRQTEKKERSDYKDQRVSVCKEVFYPSLTAYQPDPQVLHLNMSNKQFSCNTRVHLLGGYDYDDYRMRWNAGFQTENVWPDTFSYDLEYKQVDAVGDARTNWELNRHFQLALLSKDYAATCDTQYLQEFETLFHDWNNRNPFLHGIAWTSVMEVAIRCINWIYAYGFLAQNDGTETLLVELKNGILNMTGYIAEHYSRYSSANNHLIVEACAIGHSGILFHHQEWTDLAVNILTRELPLQNYSDGVNRELSLHYQSFYMEAMGLMLRLMQKNGYAVPPAWTEMLDKMCMYVADCIGDYGEAVVFGDDDEGKILDLAGVDKACSVHDSTLHYRTVLLLLGILLRKTYLNVECPDNETLQWLFTQEEFDASSGFYHYKSPQYSCYQTGGNTIMRSQDRRVLIGIDHAALGFGSICAHGHADALSFQAFLDGKPIFVDPGTYIYHCDLSSRNAFRETANHNTVCIDGKNQSEMLGPFLWGRKANAELVEFKKDPDGCVQIVMTQDGYKPIIHMRTLQFDGYRKITIKDKLTARKTAKANFLLGPGIELAYGHDPGCVTFGCGQITFSGQTESPQFVEYPYSHEYGIREKTMGISVSFDSELVTIIELQQ